MKLRTSFCNGTVLKKDITRFAPLWAIYLVGGLLVTLSVQGATYDHSRLARNLADTIGGFSVMNLIYAALCAQMLFGDLFQSRMCNALHAMPLRREGWFCTHGIAGLLFSLVPHGIAALVFALRMGSFWYVAQIWLLGMLLEYLFFFGLAVFSVFCVGNRVAQTAIYGILNFGAAILYWFISTFYAPLLYGIQIPQEPFMEFCPVVKMCGLGNLVLFQYLRKEPGRYEYDYAYEGLGEGWGYLTLCALLGLVLLGLALLLYRRRKLETAGNFIAVKPLEPIFAVIFTLCAGAVFAAVGQLFYGADYVVYLIVGLVLGWFVGQMLLRRTVKVFQGKTFLKLAVLGLVMGGSLFVTSLDPLGVTRWLPEQADVALVEVDTGSQIRKNSANYLKIDTPEKIGQALQVHQTMIEAGEPSASLNGGGAIRSFVIRYTLKSGRQVSRFYTVRSDTAAWRALSKLYSEPEQILGYTDWETFVHSVVPTFNGYELSDLCSRYTEKYEQKTDCEQIQRELLEALKQDVEDGNLSKDTFDAGKADYVFTVELQSNSVWRFLAIRKNAANTMAWYEAYREIVDMKDTIS